MRAKHWSPRRRRRFEERKQRKADATRNAAESREMFEELAETRPSEFEQLALETNQQLVPFDDSPMGSFNPDMQPAPRMRFARLRIVASNDAPTQAEKRQLELALPTPPSLGHWL